MFYDYDQAVKSSVEDPLLVFNLIKEGYYDLVVKAVEAGVNINTTDQAGNDIVTRLLIVKAYDQVLLLMKKRKWNINHQNLDGNTFGHILAKDSSIHALKVIHELSRSTRYLPNVKNNFGETILDIANKYNSNLMAIKIIEDKKFNNIDVISFKNIIDICCNNKLYGKYTKFNNLEIIVDSLEKKDNLLPNVQLLVDEISNNMDIIRKELMNNRYNIVDRIINMSMKVTS